MKRPHYKHVYVIASEGMGEQYVCYQGIDINEARLTIATLRREDWERGEKDRYSYMIKVEKPDGTLERWTRKR